MLKQISKPVSLYLLFIAASLFLFGFITAHIPLWSSDEGRYGEIAREMLESRDFIVPSFNYVDYLEKPVLSPLFTALMYGLFGVSAVATRIPSILCALGGIFLTFFFIRRLFNARAAGYSALALLTSVGYVLVGRFAVIDMQMIFLLSGAVFCLMTGFFEKNRAAYLAAYFFMGLGFLTKGLIAPVLPAMIFGLFLLWSRRWDALKEISLGRGLLILALVTLPWAVTISLREPEFFRVFIIEHHFQRFATGGFGRHRPFWFFTYIIPIITFPWILFVPFAIVRGLRGGDPVRQNKIRFLICWMAVIFIFFSLPKSKLPYYIVPICVPMAVLAGTFLADWISGHLSPVESRVNGWLWKIIALLCVSAVVGLNIAASLVKEPEILILQGIIRIAAVVLGAGGILAFLFYRRGKAHAAVLALAGMIYAVLLIITLGMLELSPLQSAEPFAVRLKPLLQADDVVAVYGSPDRFSDLPFYLQRRVMVAGTDRGTLARESAEEGHREESLEWFLKPEEFARFFNGRTRRVFCLLEAERLPELTQQDLGPYKTIMEDSGKMLLSNELP